MRDNPTRVYASAEEMGRGINIRIMLHAAEDGSAQCVTNLVTGTVEAGKRIPICLKLSNQEAVSMIDSLWLAGVRPSNGEGSSGQLAATEKHLKDMRTIAFSSMGIGETHED
ncbi:MAG: hypothetical protein KAU20_01225 [Nanoarchaeota archaeon]|nr:hypothetical protein [Nanoarchaeota archaeon]